MKKIERSDSPIKNAYNISLQVKKRYVDPLVKTSTGAERLSKINSGIAKQIEDFLNFKDSEYGAVPWL